MEIGRLFSRRFEDTVPWPALLDLVTSTLMIFLLVSFLQVVSSNGSVEAVRLRRQQDRFERMWRSEFSGEMRRGVIDLQRNVESVRVTFSDRILFASGDYALQEEGRQLLLRCAKRIAAEDGLELNLIQVEGHTDDRPVSRTEYPSTNWQLSAARAISVVELLTGEGKLPPRIVSANGYAQYWPVAGNETDRGRAKNRRIEIRFFFRGAPHQAGERAKP